MPDQRIEIKFARRFSLKSDNGRVFSWLKQHFGSEYEDAIINIVRSICLPIALAESGASLSETETEVNQAKKFFNEKMMLALGSCSRQESASSIYSNEPAPISEKIVPPTITASTKRGKRIINGAVTTSASATQPDNNFLELDEDKFTED